MHIFYWGGGVSTDDFVQMGNECQMISLNCKSYRPYHIATNESNFVGKIVLFASCGSPKSWDGEPEKYCLELPI